MGPLDTVSRQIFGDIQETQFSGSKMEVHVHLKNAFQAELETEGSRLATIFCLPPTPPWGGGSFNNEPQSSFTTDCWREISFGANSLVGKLHCSRRLWTRAVSGDEI